MNNHPVLFALAACFLAAIGEGLFMGRDGSRFLKTLNQPRWAPPLWAWTLIGIAWYAICFFSLYRLAMRPSAILALLGLLLLMAANTFWNFVYFRRRDMRLAFLYSAVYAAFATALLALLAITDAAVAVVFGTYVLYLPYALVLSYKTWKLNI